MLDQLRPDDIVVVWKLDRLARSTHQLFDIVERIWEAQSSFQSISEPWADTTSPGGKMIITVFAGIAEFERDLIPERTSAGRAVANGPSTGGGWKNYGKLKGMQGDKRHCHLKGKPTYVCCWEVLDIK